MINVNSIIKMKIKLKLKPLLWDIPHFYLCWNQVSSTHNFFIFTSNFFKLFAQNISSTNDICVIAPKANLPFTKTTYIVLNESYNITNITEPNNYYYLNNAFDKVHLEKFQEKGLSSKSFNIKSNEYKLK